VRYRKGLGAFGCQVKADALFAERNVIAPHVWVPLDEVLSSVRASFAHPVSLCLTERRRLNSMLSMRGWPIPSTIS
jgi:hypothetical protein